MRQAVSVDRLRRLRERKDKGEWLPAIARYLWNLELARSLYPVLHAAEVVLRNHLFFGIGEAVPLAGRTTRLGCWLDATPSLLLDKEREKVEFAIIDFEREQRRREKDPSKRTRMPPGHLVAELRFGFWTKLLDGAYDDWRNPSFRIWPLMEKSMFPNCPPAERNRNHIHVRFTEIKELRNRVFHHEPILRRMDLAVYDRCVEAVEWINPDAARQLLAIDKPRVAQLLAEKEGPYLTWLRAEVANPGQANPVNLLGLPQ
jgi:hypothetical protein